MQLLFSSRAAALAVVVSLAASGLVAQPSFGGTAEVATVKFDRVRPDWYQVEVAVEVKAADGNVSRYVDRVGVGLNLGFKLSMGGERFEFYRARATAVSVRQGRSTFRFYLPPEIVDRDKLAGAAHFWAVDLAVGGEAMPRTARQVSSSLPSPAALESFLAKILAEAPRNDGVLVPQYQSPFASAENGVGFPSYVRPPVEPPLL